MEVDEVIRQIFGLDELQERSLRVGGGHHHLGVQLIAVLQRDSHSPPALDDDLLYAGVDPDLHPQRPRRIGDGPAHTARAALGKAPGRGTRRRSRPCSDAAARTPFPASAVPGMCR